MPRCPLTHVGRVSTIVVCCLRFVAMFFALSASLTAQADTLNYYYDGAGRLVQMTEPGGSVQYRYDNAGNLIEVIRTALTTDPVIAEFSPNSGPVGTVVTIVGQGFSATASSNTVKFAGTTATVLSASPNTLTVGVPAGASTGRISVKVGSKSAMSAENFKVTAHQAMRIDGFTPTLAAPGDTITITGVGFGTSLTETTVVTNGYTARIISIIDTRIVAIVGATATSGKVEVRNRNGSLQAAGDLYVTPPSVAIADVAYTHRVNLDDPPLQLPTLPPGKVALIVFDGDAAQGVGLGVSPLTISASGIWAFMEIALRAPSGGVVMFTDPGQARERVLLGTAGSVDAQLPLTGTHTFSMAAMEATVNATISLSADTTGVLTQNGAAQTFNAPLVGQNARYTFEAEAGQNLSLMWTDTTFPDLYLPIAVFDSSKTMITTPYDVALIGRPSGVLDLPVLTSGGEYKVVVNPDLSSGNTTLQLKAHEKAPIEVSGAVKSVNLSGGQNGRYTFNAIAGQSFGLGISGVSTAPAAVQVKVHVLRPDKTMLVDCSTATPGGSCNIPPLLVGGEYTVLVDPPGINSATMDLTLSLDTTASMTLNPQQLFAITRFGQNARYTFTAVAGERATVFWSGNTFAGGRMQIFAPNGNQVWIGTFDNGVWASGSTFPIELVAGEYTVFVDPAGLNLGQIDLRLETGKPDLLVVPPVTIGRITMTPEGVYQVPITYSVRNAGDVFAFTPWVEAAYLSADTTLGSGDVQIGSLSPGNHHGTGATQVRQLDLAIPGTNGPGPVNVILNLDNANTVAEKLENNNTHAFVVNLPTKADLRISNFSAANIRTRPEGNYAVDVSLGITNAGGLEIPNFQAGVFLSSNAVLDDGDTRVALLEFPDSLAGGGTTSIAGRIVTFDVPQGSYYLLLKLDSDGRINESNEANNVASQAITLLSKPDLAISSVTHTPPVFSDNAYSVTVSYTVTNIGGYSATVDWRDEAFLSTNSALGSGDIYVGGSAITQNLGPNQSYSITDKKFSFPTGQATGSYTLFVKADARHTAEDLYSNDHKLVEQNENNNHVGIPITLGAKPDLRILNPVIGAPFPNPDGSFSIQVDFDVKNFGSADATGTWYDMMFLSTNATLNGTDAYLNQQIRNTPLAPDATFHVSKKVTTATSVEAAMHTLFLKTDATETGGFYSSTGRVGESDETNNVSSHPADLLNKPNLSLSGLTVGTPSANEDGTYSIQVDFTVTNTGTVPAVAPWNDIACLSTDGTLDTTDDYLNQQIRNTDLAVNGSYLFSKKLTTGTISGLQNKTLFLKIDGDSTGGKCSLDSKLGESNETDNVQSRVVALGKKADLVVSALNNTSITVRSNGDRAFTVTGTIENRGDAAATATPNWPDGVYLSSDNVLDINDLFLGQVLRSTDVAAGGNYAYSKAVTIPAAQPAGPYYLFLKADGANADGKYALGSKVVESNESNNTRSKSITLP